MPIKKILITVVLSLVSFPIFANASTTGSNATPEEIALKTPAKGTVALTFDDGPNPEYTLKILEVLKKYNVKATFFEVGAEAKKYPEIVKALDAAGMAIGSHSQTHPMMTKLSDAQLENEVAQPVEIINNIIGKKPVCLRYPFGASNQHVRDVIRAHNMVPLAMGWNTFDYEQPGIDKIVNQALKANSGIIILMHDGFVGLNREQTLEALPRIIEGLQKKGLGFTQICNENTPTTNKMAVASPIKNTAQ